MIDIRIAIKEPQNPILVIKASCIPHIGLLRGVQRFKGFRVWDLIQFSTPGVGGFRVSGRFRTLNPKP